MCDAIRIRCHLQALIEENEVELGAINKSLHAVHEIFKDLALMVSQQQEQVSTQHQIQRYLAANLLNALQRLVTAVTA